MTQQQRNILKNGGFNNSQIEALESVFVTGVTSTDFWNSVRFFKKSEFSCKCGGKYCNGYPVEPDKNLVFILDLIREDANTPCVISSGIRCETHNANVGGVPNSWHKKGKAADFALSGKTSAQTISYAKKYAENISELYAIDNRYVHMAVK